MGKERKCGPNGIEWNEDRKCKVKVKEKGNHNTRAHICFHFFGFFTLLFTLFLLIQFRFFYPSIFPFFNLLFSTYFGFFYSSIFTLLFLLFLVVFFSFIYSYTSAFLYVFCSSVFAFLGCFLLF